MRCIFLSIICCVFGSVGLLQADWNEKFDRQSEVLIRQIEEFRGGYQEIYASFIKTRKGLLKDFMLNKQIGLTALDQRMILLRPREGIVIKKRSNDRMLELFSWELSYLLGGGDFLVPSFPVEIAGKKVIIQKMEPFTFKKDKVMESIPKEAKKVTVEEYWKAHLQAYLLGLGDLVGQNIGVNALNHIRFFDAEYSLCYLNEPVRTELSFKPGFMSQSLEWPQYRQPLDHKTVTSLKRYIESMASLESKLETYLLCRAAPVNVEGLLFRLEKVRTFPLEEGSTFRDFYGFIFPKLNPGLDELARIVSGILQRTVDHGSALIMLCRWIERYDLSSSERRAIESWMSRYID
ncbi:MAG: hypothetical protein V4489_10015 [Chlamydiota bacterium]